MTKIISSCDNNHLLEGNKSQQLFLQITCLEIAFLNVLNPHAKKSQMKNHLLLSLILLTVFAYGCKEDAPTATNEKLEYLIFGRFAGECLGDQCIEIYKLENNRLYESEDIYPTSSTQIGNTPYQAGFTEIDNPASFVIDELLSDFPMSLLADSKSVLGCPDCADQGGYFLEISTSSKIANWRIDTDRSAIPAYLSPYLDLLDEKILLLRD